MTLELVIAGVALFVACVALVYAIRSNERMQGLLVDGIPKWLERELRGQQEQIWAIQAGLRELGMELVKPKPPVAAKWVKRESNLTPEKIAQRQAREFP